MKTTLNVELACEDHGYSRDYYRVMGGKNEGLIICRMEEKWYTVMNSNTEGEPWYAIDMDKFEIEVLKGATA